jgi:pectinesterase
MATAQASYLLLTVLLTAALTTARAGVPQAELVVAADGTGQYKTVQDAISAASSGTQAQPTVIRVKPGVYHELIYAQREKRFVRLVGGDPDASKTVITYAQFASQLGPDGKPIGTFRTATATIDADDFSAENMTFDNSAGDVGQAVAVRVDGDRVAFKNCRFTGWQDTILDNRGRHYYDQCTVTGAVDFIFGGATAVYDHSEIVELRNRGGVLTAPSTPQDQEFGLIFLNCHISQTATVQPGLTGLMRPWRAYGESVFIDCTLDHDVSDAGWNKWDGKEQTCRAYEYHSVDATGRPVDISKRAAWSKQLSPDEAAKYTQTNVFGNWDAKAAE